MNQEHGLQHSTAWGPSSSVIAMQHQTSLYWAVGLTSLSVGESARCSLMYMYMYINGTAMKSNESAQDHNSIYATKHALCEAAKLEMTMPLCSIVWARQCLGHGP